MGARCHPIKAGAFSTLLLLALAGCPAAHGAVGLRGLWTSFVNSKLDTAAPSPNGCHPQQVLMSLGSDVSEMHLSWKTASANCPSEVVYQRLDDRLTFQQLQQLQRQEDQQPAQQLLQLGMANTYNAMGYDYLLSERDMCDTPAASNVFTWHLHRATFKDLEPSASYRYRIEGGLHHTYFRAAPEPSPDSSFTFLGFGDLGDAVHPAAKSPGAASTLLRLRQEVEASHNPAELMLHVGDLSYANGDPDIWDSFLEGIDFAARLPYMVAVGNHEYGYTAKRGSSSALTDPSGAAEPYQPSWGNYGPDSRGECGVPTARRFHMPNSRNRRDNAPFWYGFDYGSVHFTVLSTEHSLVPGSRQYSWLEQELEGVDRCRTPWLVVLLHRPMYVVYPHKSNREVGEHIRNQIEPLLLQHKVDMTIAGHVHSYYRTCPVQDEDCTDEYGTLQAVPTVSAMPHDIQPGGGVSASGAADGINYLRGEVASRSSTDSSISTLLLSNLKSTAPATTSDSLQKGRHGIVHFVIGSAGHKLSDVERGQEDWCAETIVRWGFGRFTVRGSRSLLAEYVSSETGEVLDSVELQATDAARGAVCGAGRAAVATN